MNKLNAVNTMHERVMRGHEGDTNPTSIKLRLISRQARASLQALAAQLDARDPTVTEALHYKRVGQNAKKLMDQSTEAFAQIQPILRQGLLEIDAKIASKVNLVEDSKTAAEVRAYVRSLTPADRHKLLRTMATNNDGPELAAILNSKEYLTGVSKEDGERYKAMILDLHAKDEVTEAASLMALFNEVLAVIDTTKNAAQEATDPERLVMIERGEQAAAKANAAFEAALKGEDQ